MESFVIDPSRLVGDIVAYVAELKSSFKSQQHPISDDDLTLQKLCVKLETLLRHEQKEKYTLLGHRKDYWHFIQECISKDEGVRYVQAIPQVTTAQGKGRAFIRYALAKKMLADTIQRLLVNKNTLSSWFKPGATLRSPSLATTLINKLYDLNDVDFILPCTGYDLDISWPAFSRRLLGEGPSSRRSSISSMSSVDFRSDRADPLVGLAIEVSSLRQLFADQSPLLAAENSDGFDTVSVADQPSVSDLTLSVSRVHQQALRWKNDLETERYSAIQQAEKALEDRNFAIRESELKSKQLMEKYSLLSKTASEDANAKCRELKEKLSLAEKSLSDRDAELAQLRNEINQSVMAFNNAQRESIDLEKQLAATERKHNELISEYDSLNAKLQAREQHIAEQAVSIVEYKHRISSLEQNESECKERLFELTGSLRAKEVALENVQESFEKLNGMVFGSFEELEMELKGRLMDREKGLQNQSMENRKLAQSLDELRQQLRDMKNKLSYAENEAQRLRDEIAARDVTHSSVCEELQGKIAQAESELQRLRDETSTRDVKQSELRITLENKLLLVEEELKTLREDNDVREITHSALCNELNTKLSSTQGKLQGLRDASAAREVQHSEQRGNLEIEISRANDEVQRLRDENTELGVTHSMIRDEMREMAVAMRCYEGLMTDLRAKLSDCVEANDECDGSFEGTLESVEQRSNALVRLVDKLTKRLSDITSELQQATNQMDKYRSQIQDNTSKIESLEAEKRAITTDLESSIEKRVSIEKELQSVKEQLETGYRSRDVVESELAVATERCRQNAAEISDQQHEILSLNEENTAFQQQLEKREKHIQELSESLDSLQDSLATSLEKNQSLQLEQKKIAHHHKSLQDEIFSLSEEKASLTDELGVARQQQEAANEGRIRAERAQLKSREELESLRCMMDQEVAALKFQLSSEAIKYESKIKVLTVESQESARYQDRAAEQADLIAELETKLKERSEAWLNEKQKYTNDIKHIKTEVQLCKNALDGTKQKVLSLENDLLLTSKQLEKERYRHDETKRKMASLENKHVTTEQALKVQIGEMEKDARELKDRLITLTQEKAELWRKADNMEHELKVKAADRWISDDEVNKCTSCKAEFSFLLRKHHCRMCGRIFCHSCSNNWVRTPHSRKMKRVCQCCLENDKQIKPQHVTHVGEAEEDDCMSDVSADDSRRSTSLLSFLSDDESPSQAREEHKKGTAPLEPTQESKENSNIGERPTNLPTHTSPELKPKSPDSNDDDISQHEYASLKTVQSSPSEGRQGSVVTPEGEGFEVIDPHEEMEEVPESRVVVGASDDMSEMVIPAVNDEQGVVRHVLIPAGLRHVLPLMVGTPGVTLRWNFKTAYKSVIFGLGFKDSETRSYDEIETIIPLSRYSSHEIPVEGDWMVVCPGVYLLVFDNTFSRFTSKQITLQVNLQR
ncbi:FYVE and coiled-coil domain-containing protein 1 isoform X2 [Nematostella vectensis]|uniref:FYVE and coiled-coil domain-containing protein 1 isoform X2 n=1 Tax=Nematostella vectensis TaxID=45351 RepID=UPI0020773925|nr:FYVE and coiled-coil domain-containing protein 1 isoform X2 [Nematostella vectensis]